MAIDITASKEKFNSRPVKKETNSLVDGKISDTASSRYIDNQTNLDDTQGETESARETAMYEIGEGVTEKEWNCEQVTVLIGFKADSKHWSN